MIAYMPGILATMTDSAREGVDGFLEALLGDDLRHPDPIHRYHVSTQVQDLIGAAHEALSALRQGALAEMSDSGMDNQQIADALGDITRQRVSQLLATHRKALAGKAPLRAKDGKDS
jgi:hypothetical protein